MTKSVCGMAIVLAMMTGGGALAQDAVKGLYMGSAELCAQAKKDGLQSVIEANNMILTNRGFETIEFNCAFLQFTKHPRMPGGWVVTSMCEEPDNAYPEMFSIVERRPGELDVAALSEVREPPQEPEPSAEAPAPPAEGGAAPAGEVGTDAGEEGQVSTGLSGTYFFCDGVNRP